MKIFRTVLIIISTFPIFFALGGCGSDNDNKIDARDAHPAADGTIVEHPATDGSVIVDTGTPDVATPTDTAKADAAVDVGTPDVAIADAGADVKDAPVDQGSVQRLVHTVLVIDQLPDGSVPDSGTDAPQMPAVDPNLVNPWGLAFNPTGPIWVADNHTGLSTVYSAQGAILPLVVTIPPPTGGTPPSAPTGLVFNPTASFMGDHFIFSSEDGTIVGWQTGTTASLRVGNTAETIYKGLTLGLRNNIPRLYATDFHNRKVDVFDAGYNKITTTGGFADPSLPAGFAPFGIQADGSVIIVTYAKQDANAEDDVSGLGNGYVDVFDFDGVFTKRLISQGALNSPWGLAMAPSDFGGLSHALLVGNFGDGKINAYDASTGAFLSAGVDTTGAPIVLPGLWALVFGNDTAGAAHNQLFYTAGGTMEDKGALGRIDFVP